MDGKKCGLQSLLAMVDAVDTVKFAKGCDLIIHDAQYSTEDYLSIYVPKQGFGHSTFEIALDCKKQVGANKMVFYHYDPSYNDERLDDLAEEYASKDAIMSDEGLEIDFFSDK